ncbi:Hypothetical predicted protein [Pelobates cultripes]|uniref:Uncharacterized protein n=1 Tax=Pelobates cultripes TaxID=61616 RepID=A0AAD1S9D4_PELCU|nr:Hypothetical predicted protein [Pelobates cultripes]
MGRTKRVQMTPSTPRTQGDGPSASIRAYLHTPGILASQHEASNMAPTSPGSTVWEDSLHTTAGTRDTEGPSQNWYALYDSLPKKEDLHTIVQEVKSTRTEIVSLRTFLSDLEGRVTALESAGPVPQQTHKHDRQLMDLRLHVEDLDNRSRRNNIRVRGLRETAGSENLRETLTPLFNIILNRPPEACLYIDKAHCALRPKPPPAALPRDVICYIQDVQLKEDNMKGARTERTWRYKGQNVELYNDLSHLTLQTRRALRPVTTILQEHHLRYRWHFPFALTARKDNIEATIRLPADVPIFLDTLGLPTTPVRDWIDCPLNERNLGRPVTHPLGTDRVDMGTVPPHQIAHEE